MSLILIVEHHMAEEVGMKLESVVGFSNTKESIK